MSRSDELMEQTVKPYEIAAVSGSDAIFSVLLQFGDLLPDLSGGDEAIWAAAEMLAKYSIVLTLRCEGKIAAFAAVYANDTVSQTAYIPYIAAHPEYRECGFDSVLFRRAEEYSAGQGMQRLKLEVQKKDTQTLDLCRRHGMEYEGDASPESIYLIKSI